MQLADHGNMQAQVVLGLMHRYGQGVSQNAVLAENYYLKAAQRGYPQGESNLVTFYLSQARHREQLARESRRERLHEVTIQSRSALVF